RVAAERAWERRVFTRRTELRPRAGRAVPLAAAGAAMAIAGGGAAWWWLRNREDGHVPRGVDGQSTRSLRAAITPRATRMARRISFFMGAG
ncbi:MAG TPA: hypothetical protein VNY84_04335, partial [Acidimicrobiales bacterium]|nr:hypothetical protein [Acidimicrobiales bacterium]